MPCLFSWNNSKPINSLKLYVAGVGVPAVYRGMMLFVGAILSLLFIDHDEGQQHQGYTHLFSNISSWLDFADHKVMGKLHNDELHVFFA